MTATVDITRAGEAGDRLAVYQSKPTMLRRAYETLRDLNTMREVECKMALQFLDGCQKIVDVGCGAGRFIKHAPKRITGSDISNFCVEQCLSQGFTAKQGDALALPFADNSFDGAYSGHIMHMFGPSDVAKYVGELIRVVKPEGVIVIGVRTFTQRAWDAAEDFKPYPPKALRGLLASEFKGLARQEDIWFRRPALIEFQGQASDMAAARARVLNGFQIGVGLRKYWSFDHYAMKIRNSKVQ